jgi:hypothetical protein
MAIIYWLIQNSHTADQVREIKEFIWTSGNNPSSDTKADSLYNDYALHE